MGDKSSPGWPPGEWFLDLSDSDNLVAFQKQETLVFGKTRFQDYEIFISRQWGKVLLLDGRLQCAQADEFIYHEALVHPAILAHPDPRLVLVVGGGEGATLREALRHPGVESAMMVDLDRELVEVCRKWLPEFHQGAFDDPRAELVFADGRSWLAAQRDGSFDVIILDLPEPLEEGPALMLFTAEFYALVKSKLAAGGLAALQSGAAGPRCRLLADLNRTLRGVFPRVVAYTAYIPSFMDLYGFHIAGDEGFSWPAVRRLTERIQALPPLGWLAPAFAAGLPHLPAYLQARLDQGRSLTDAAPFLSKAGEGQVYF